MGRFKNILAIFIVAVAFWLFSNGDCLALEIETFDSYTASSSVSAISASWASTTANYAYVSANTYGSSSPQSAQLLSDTHFIIPDYNIGNYFTDFSYRFRFQNASFSLIDKNLHYVGKIVFDMDAGDGYGDIYLTNYNGSITTNYITIASAGTIADNEWRMLTVDWDETNSQYRAKLDTTSYTAYATTTYATPARLLWSGITGGSPFYIDDFIYNDNEGDVTIIELPDWTGNVVVMSENFSFENPMYCSVGYSCRLWINYPISSVGDTVYLINESVTEIITQQELIGGQLMKDYLTLPSQDSAQTINYYVVDEGATTTAYKLQVIWSEENTALLDLFAQYNCDTVCNDLATSTNLWEQIDYGLQCATRKGVCWLFVPDQDTLMAFSESINTIKNNFPFTVYYQVKTNIFDINLASTSASTISTNNIIPGLNVVLASSTMMTTAWGNVWNSFYQALTYIIYLLGFSYFVWRLFAITQKRDDDDV